MFATPNRSRTPTLRRIGDPDGSPVNSGRGTVCRSSAGPRQDRLKVRSNVVDSGQVVLISFIAASISPGCFVEEMRKTKCGARPLLQMNKLGSRWTWVTTFKYERAGRGLAVEDRRAGWSSGITLDLRKEIGVHSSAEALSWRVETGSGEVARDWRRKPSLDRQRETHD